MYYNGQTLRHKERNELVRLDPEPQGGTAFAWEIGTGTALIREDGTKFKDDINNYTHIEDELGRPYCGYIKEGQFVDESAKRYLVPPEQLLQMRETKLLEWEADVLARMDGTYSSPQPSTIDGKVVIRRVIRRGGSDIPGKYVLCPFADGSHSGLFQEFFLTRRNAKPLYQLYNNFEKGFVGGPLTFWYKGQQWLYDCHMSHLVVIEVEK